MFDTKRNDQAHTLTPPEENGADMAETRNEPGFSDAHSLSAETFAHRQPKREAAGAPKEPNRFGGMNFADRMAMGGHPAQSARGPAEFARTTGDPASAELVEEVLQVHERADKEVHVAPKGEASIRADGDPDIHADINEAGSTINAEFRRARGHEIPQDVDSPAATSENDRTPQFGLPVDARNLSPKIGAILVANGKLTEEIVAIILEQQEREPSARFGELAVRGRYVSQKDVDDALASQFGFASSSQVGYGLPSEIVTAHHPFSPFAEALRGLRSQLMLRWFDGSPQQSALAVTSVDRADGKSFICSNLGVVFSQLGEKTLIIDADLRNSTQHLKFGLPNKMGLSGVLSGRAGIEEILAVSGLNNLAVLPAGPLPPNPQELLGREDFGRFLAAMSASFDVILIDTPSAQQASDAQVVAQRARAALIVGRKDKTKSTEITQLGGVMSSAGVKLLGATLNEY